MIAAAGVLSTEEVEKEDADRKAAMSGESGKDVWEDYPIDESSVDTDKPEEGLQVAQKLKDIGTTSVLLPRSRDVAD